MNVLLIVLLLWLVVWFIYSIYSSYFSKLRDCTWNDSWMYKGSIGNALEADHPAKIVFILNNTLAELNRLGLTEYNSYSTQVERVNTKSQQSFMQTYGIPSSRKLKDAIDLAEEFCEQWEELTRRGGKAAQIQAMDRIKQVFSSEFFYLDYIGSSSNVYCKKDQKSHGSYYWDGEVTAENIQERWKTFDYNTGYYYKTSNTRIQHNSTTEAEQLRNNNSKHQAVNNSPVNPLYPPSQMILEFEKFMQQNPGLLYLELEDQRKEYYKYLASMGVQPPSHQTRPNNYQDNNDIAEYNKYSASQGVQSSSYQTRPNDRDDNDLDEDDRDNSVW